MKTKKNTQPEEPQKDAENTAEQAAGAAEQTDADTKSADNTAANAKKDKADTAGKTGKKELSEAEVIKLLLQSQKTEMERLQKELDAAKAAGSAAQAKADTLNSRLAATLAEYENYRRRTTTEKQTLGADATAKAIKALLPALDSLERALSFAEADSKTLRDGVQMTCKQFNDAFAKLGVVEMDIKPGDAFDPDRHNAVAHVEDESLGESVVAEVFQKGYAIGDKVIRHAVVKVAN